MYIMASLLVVGFICNKMIKPVDKKHFMADDPVRATHAGGLQPQGAAA
jgi:hypothetical protein